MRFLTAVALLFAAISAARAQCPIGSYPVISGGRQVCQSAAGQTTTSPWSSTESCPPGTDAGYDSWGHRTCTSLNRNGYGAGSGGSGGFEGEPRRRY